MKINTLLSSIPKREQTLGQFNPFTALIELNSGTNEKILLNDLKNNGKPIFEIVGTEYKIDFNKTFDEYSIIRHELAHFFQGLISPMMLNFSLEKQVIMILCLAAIDKKIKDSGNIKLPLKLNVLPNEIAFNLLFEKDDLLGFSAISLIEAQAIYYQFMLPDHYLAERAIGQAILKYNEQNIANGLYSHLYKSFCWDFRNDAYYLFPLVSWASLLNWIDSDFGQRRTVAIVFLTINEILFDSPKGKDYFSKLMSNPIVNKEMVWSEFIEFVEKKSTLKLESLQQSHSRFLKYGLGLSKKLDGLVDSQEFFPFNKYIEKQAKYSYSGLVSKLLFLYNSNSYNNILNEIGKPAILNRIGKPLGSNEKELDSHFEYQKIWHQTSYFFDRVTGFEIDNICPHTLCPNHKEGFCSGFRNYPISFSDCKFEYLLRKVVGFDLNNIGLYSEYQGELVVNYSDLSVDIKYYK